MEIVLYCSTCVSLSHGCCILQIFSISGPCRAVGSTSTTSSHSIEEVHPESKGSAWACQTWKTSASRFHIKREGGSLFEVYRHVLFVSIVAWNCEINRIYPHTSRSYCSPQGWHAELRTPEIHIPFSMQGIISRVVVSNEDGDTFQLFSNSCTSKGTSSTRSFARRSCSSSKGEVYISSLLCKFLFSFGNTALHSK